VDLQVIAALEQPLRRRLYALLSSASWLSRDEAAASLDVPRSVAAFHLDKLVDAGLAEVTFERTTGRTGPGAGRPAKLYRRLRDEVSASVPERHYDLAGALLADAIVEAERTSAPVADCIGPVATAAGRRHGEATDGEGTAGLLDAQVALGYEPRAGADGAIVLGNCPFHRLAEEHRELICGMNLDLVRGLVAGLTGVDAVEARLVPDPATCCVRLET
jgi:predicted ArsR family transcriptional regulator